MDKYAEWFWHIRSSQHGSQRILQTSNTKEFKMLRLSQRLCLLHDGHSFLIPISVLGIAPACTAVTCNHMMERETFLLLVWLCLTSSLHKSSHTPVCSGSFLLAAFQWRQYCIMSVHQTKVIYFMLQLQMTVTGSTLFNAWRVLQ